MKRQLNQEGGSGVWLRGVKDFLTTKTLVSGGWTLITNRVNNDEALIGSKH